MLTHGSAFSGIGGAEVAADLAGGYEHAWSVELADHPAAILERRYPGVRLERDVTDRAAMGRLPAVDVLTAGFPCQPFSVAGRRAGADDGRNLWPDTGRLICETRPRVALLENVPALRNPHDGGREPAYFGAVLGDLAALGYDAWWDCVPAAAVGAHHRRDRVWIVAFRSDVEPFDPFRSFRDGTAAVGPYWPTPQAHDTSAGDPDRDWRFGSEHGGRNLNDAVANALWATPTVSQPGGTAEQFVERKREARERGASLGASVTDLRMQVGRALWATPLAGDGQGGRTSKGRPRPEEAGLRGSVRAALAPWPTVTTNQRGKYNRDHGDPDLERPNLHGAVEEAVGDQWPTPASRDHRAANTKPYRERGGESKGEQLPNAVRDAVNAVPGVLNPEWVEMLMGYPRGWTDRADELGAEEAAAPPAWHGEGVLRVGDVAGTNPAYADHWYGLADVSPLRKRDKQTTPRLMALGNAWVPQVAAPILAAIHGALS